MLFFIANSFEFLVNKVTLAFDLPEFVQEDVACSRESLVRQSSQGGSSWRRRESKWIGISGRAYCNVNVFLVLGYLLPMS